MAFARIVMVSQAIVVIFRNHVGMKSMLESHAYQGDNVMMSNMDLAC